MKTNRKLCFSALLLILLQIQSISAEFARIRVHHGFTQIHDVSSEIETIQSYSVNEKYTFEIYLTETMQRDYVIEECTMNNNVFIGQNGCVQCGNCVEQSIETEAYNKPGAIKRTLVHFIARSSQIVFKCKIREIDCSGCAERSCQRQHQIFLNQYIYHTTTLMHPASGYANGMFPPPQYPHPPPPPSIYPTPYFGGSPPYQIPPPAAPPMMPGGGAALAHGGSSSGVLGTWPWWIWLLLLLLLLLLLCCLIALCFALWMRKRKQKKTITTTTTVAVTDSGKDCGVGTEKVAVHCVSTDTNDIVKVQPAIVVGGNEEHSEHHSAARYQSNKHHQREDTSDEYGASGGSYSLREGRVHENYSRTVPYDSNRFNDRQSYRNFAYERDMGRVEPLDGYDEVETRERTYCLSDDEQEIVERDVKRTHTTRFVQETREFDTEEESYRGDEHHHASYTHSLPV